MGFRFHPYECVSHRICYLSDLARLKLMASVNWKTVELTEKEIDRLALPFQKMFNRIGWLAQERGNTPVRVRFPE